MKKLLCIILSIAVVCCCICVPAFAATMTLKDETYPTEIVKGNTFSAYGIITSDYNILRVEINVINSSGKSAFSYIGNPGTKTYNIHDVDYLLTFSKLDAGTYTYKITASDTQSSNVVLLSKKFEVVTSAAASTLKISGENYPTSYIQGNTFSVHGTVTSDYTITSVTCGVYNSAGTVQFSKTATPDASVFDVNDIDYYMTFSKLAAGTYTYKIIASDTKAKNVVLLQKTFTVVKQSGGAETDLKKVNWDVIDLSYWNDIESWDKIADAVDGVILRIGYRATVNHRIGGDSCFLDFYKAAKEQGLPVGCYFFSAALTTAEAVEEADFVLKMIKDNNLEFDMPIYFDMETEDQVDLSQSACTAVARAFCDKMKANGCYVGVYCNKYFARDELYASQLSDVTMWIAQFGSKCTYGGPYGMWQYSETGSVPGLYEYVDMDYCYYDFPEYIKAKGYNGYKAPETPTVTTEYGFKTEDGIKVDAANKYVLNVNAGLSTSEFLGTYITRSSNVSVSFSNTVNGSIATGTTVTFKNGDKVLAAYTVSVAGDVDGNGEVNSADALCALEHSIGHRELTGVKQKSADMNSDGIVNSADALEILQNSIGM